MVFIQSMNSIFWDCECASEVIRAGLGDVIVMGMIFSIIKNRYFSVIMNHQMECNANITLEIMTQSSLCVMIGLNRLTHTV